MQDLATVANPFALMLDPASVIAAVERSERLARLHSTICRPLDKVKLEGASAAERAEFFGASVSASKESAAACEAACAVEVGEQDDTDPV